MVVRQKAQATCISAKAVGVSISLVNRQKKGPLRRWPRPLAEGLSLVASLVCVHRIGKLYSNLAVCIPITPYLTKVRLVEPSQIVLSQVQSLTKADLFLRPLRTGTNSGYVAM